LSTVSYAQLSGNFTGSSQFDLALRMRATSSIVNATLLRAGERWTELAHSVSFRVEVVHMRGLRKVTGEFRSVEEDRCSEQDLRTTDNVSSTWSLLAGQRLRYLSSLRKASLFLREVLQHGGMRHPWVQLISEDWAAIQHATTKLSNLPLPQSRWSLG
jgi:hypothetical protein